MGQKMAVWVTSVSCGESIFCRIARLSSKQQTLHRFRWRDSNLGRAIVLAVVIERNRDSGSDTLVQDREGELINGGLAWRAHRLRFLRGQPDPRMARCEWRRP